jgi:hypothetical protein
MKCSICFKEIDKTPHWDQGHNAEPVNNGRCCLYCNDNVVVPARLNLIFSKTKHKNTISSNLDEKKRYK